MHSDIDEKFKALHEFVVAARERLPDSTWAYIAGGADTETSMRRNRAAIDSLALRPRVLNNVSSIECGAELFETNARLPVFLGPVGGLESMDPEGALAVARAAKSFGVPMLLSSVSEWSPTKLQEQIGDGLSLVFQLYARRDAAGIDELVDECKLLNLPAFCITVDSAIYSRRDRDIAGRFSKPWRAKGEGNAAYYQASLNWRDIERIRKQFDRQLALKGIATAEDALLAVEHGVDIIYVSNHGGRQLDHGMGSIAALSDIVNAVNGRARVMVDGGFSRGTDIAKAIALGADGVGLGRLMCFALAAAGSAGVVRMLELLEEEYRIALGLIGVQNGAQLNQSHVSRVDALHHDSALISAFPLLKEAEW
ncbi:MAG: alpha-hydroxy-acid oxidizing protein [Gammaproteobacteria bacterium]|nr:alpha-hydroxy-acid oxidizing protein [Gammaproteobacteria bacterium]